MNPFHGRRFRSWMSGSLAAVMALSVIAPGFAEKKLKNLEKPITVQLTTPLAVDPANESEAGKPFEGVLTEDHIYKSSTLPAGLAIRGHVSYSEPSQRLARPGFMVLKVDEAVFPTGETVNFKSDAYETPDEDLHHPKGKTIGKVAKDSVPYIAVGLADGIPLTAATNLPGLAVLGISIGARMTLGTIFEFAEKENGREHWPTPGRAGYGMLRGTGLTAVAYVLGRAENPDFQPGDDIEVYLDPKGLEELYHQSESL
ncbi:MAG: hypothetical protein KTR14_11040 [Vampirovibrio sp.]|nr:hypothetical protein [Vampirovibrio sp.]